MGRGGGAVAWDIERMSAVSMRSPDPSGFGKQKRSMFVLIGKRSRVSRLPTQPYE